jgi:hypothetical protein
MWQQALNGAIFKQWEKLHTGGLALPPPYYLDYPLEPELPLFVGLHPPRQAVSQRNFDPQLDLPPTHSRPVPAWLQYEELPDMHALQYIGRRAGTAWNWIPLFPLEWEDSAAVLHLFRDFAPQLASAHLHGIARAIEALQPPGAVLVHEYLRDRLHEITQLRPEFYVNFEYKVYGALRPASPRYYSHMNIAFLEPPQAEPIPVLGAPRIADPPEKRALVIRVDNKTNVNWVHYTCFLEEMTQDFLRAILRPKPEKVV